MLYAPWCGHCRALAPRVEAAAQEVCNDPAVAVATIDATAQLGLALRFLVEACKYHCPRYQRLSLQHGVFGLARPVLICRWRLSQTRDWS